MLFVFFFQAEDGIRDRTVTGVQTCALPISDQPLYARLWGSGFLDTRYQGIQFRAGKEPILYMSNPDGPCGSGRRALLDKLNALNEFAFQKELDPEIESRITQYENAYRMQSSDPQVTDWSKEPDSLL